MERYNHVCAIKAQFHKQVGFKDWQPLKENFEKEYDEKHKV